MHVFPDASPALGEKIISRSRYIQLFILIRRRDLNVSARLRIDVVQCVKLLGKAECDLVVGFFPALKLLLKFPLAVQFVNIDDPEYGIIPVLIHSTDQPERMPCRNTVYHKTVFDVLHGALLHIAEELLLPVILKENVLIRAVDHFFAVPDEINEKIIPTLLQMERMEL